MIFGDLLELKRVLEIDPEDKYLDFKLSLFNEQASDIIEEILNRKFTKKSRTEYYKGTNSQKLLLKGRPVFTTPTIQVYVDGSGNYGAASGSFDPDTSALTYGTDFFLEIDQDDGTSRSGILVRNNRVWERRWVRRTGYLTPYVDESFGSVKVIYTGGYTVDTLPAGFRFGATLLVQRMNYILPLGMAIGGEGYEERSISFLESQRDYLLNLVKPHIITYRNWFF